MKILIALLTIILFACNPVKRVLKNDNYFNQVADTVFARGLCVKDSVITIEYDTLEVVKDTTIYNTLPIYLHDTCKLDTIINGVRLVISDNGISVSQKYTIKEKVVTKTVEKKIKDISKERVLTKQITQLQDDVEKSHVDLEKAQSKLWRLRFYILLLCIYTAYSIYSKIRGLFFK